METQFTMLISLIMTVSTAVGAFFIVKMNGKSNTKNIEELKKTFREIGKKYEDSVKQLDHKYEGLLKDFSKENAILYKEVNFKLDGMKDAQHNIALQVTRLETNMNVIKESHAS